jgi:hypothetical protein
MTFSNENMYLGARGKIYNILNRSVHEFLGFAPDTILTIFYGVTLLK